MKIKKFEASSVRDAMEQARRELGEDAVILNTREVPSNGKGLFGGKARVELVAAVDDKGASLAKSSKRPAVREPKSQVAVAASSEGPELQETQVNLAGELASLKEAFESLVGEGVLVAHTQAKPGPESLLRRVGVEAILARQIADSIQSSSRDEIAKEWSCLFSCAPPILPEGRSAVWALLGPTGSGKTTSLAKMAAWYKFKKAKTVAVINCDGVRIGAGEQLQKITQLLGITCRTCLDPDDLSSAITELKDHDIVLVDTPGGSLRNPDYMPGMKRLLSDERITPHLVIPGNLSPDVRAAAVKAFGELDPKRVIVTKLDELDCCAPLIALSQETHAPWSFTGNGQDITADLRPADPQELITVAMGDL